jgi:hypothetical protein
VPPRPFNGIVDARATEDPTLHTATELLVQRCMTARHQPYSPTPPSVPPTPNPYGLLTPAEAAAIGYGLGPAADQASPGSAGPTGSTGAAWQQALTGTPAHQITVTEPGGMQIYWNTDGCVYQATVQLYGPDWNRLLYHFQSLAVQVIQRVQADRAFLAAQRSWSTCLARQHIRASKLGDPADTIDALLTKAGHNTGEIREALNTERHTAVTDARCQQDAHLITATAAAQQRAEQALLARPGPAGTTGQMGLKRFAVLRSAAVDRARDLVSSPR